MREEGDSALVNEARDCTNQDDGLDKDDIDEEVAFAVEAWGLCLDGVTVLVY